MLKLCTLLLVMATLATLSTSKLLHDPDAVAKCLVENNLTEEELNKILNEHAEDTDSVDRRLKCHTKCLFNSLKLTDDNGRLDAIKFGNHDPLQPSNEHYAEIANTCNKKFSWVKDQCENMFEVAICIGFQLSNEEEEQKVSELIRNNFTEVEKN